MPPLLDEPALLAPRRPPLKLAPVLPRPRRAAAARALAAEPVDTYLLAFCL